MLERLVQQAVILCWKDLQDRRFKHTVLTEKGRPSRLEILHTRQGWPDDLAPILSTGEKKPIETVIAGPPSP